MLLFWEPGGWESLPEAGWQGVSPDVGQWELQAGGSQGSVGLQDWMLLYTSREQVTLTLFRIILGAKVPRVGLCPNPGGLEDPRILPFLDACLLPAHPLWQLSWSPPRAFGGRCSCRRCRASRVQIWVAKAPGELRQEQKDLAAAVDVAKSMLDLCSWEGLGISFRPIPSGPNVGACVASWP